MKQANIHLMRHGQPQGCLPRRFLGQLDAPLDDTGQAQARAWRESWGPGRFRQIYCSDLARSLETARVIAGQGADLRVLPGLRELHLGRWQGMTVDEVMAAHPQAYRERRENLETYRPPGGESFGDLRTRVLPVFEQIRATAEGDILVVAHSGVNRVILCQVLGMPLPRLLRLGQDYAALNLLEVRGGEVTLRVLNQAPPSSRAK